MFFAMLAALMLIAAPAMASEGEIIVSTFDELKTEAAKDTIRTIVLSEDITNNGDILKINGTLTLDLNGCVLDTTATSNASAIHIMSNSNLIIGSAGTIKTDNEYSIFSTGYNGASLAISNGIFLGDIQSTDKNKITITGGAFRYDPSEYLRDDFEVVEESDSLYHVYAKKPVPTDIYSLKFERDAVEVLVGAPTRVTTTLTQNGAELPDYALELAGEVPEWLELKFEGNAVVITALKEGKCDVTISALVGGANKTKAVLTVNAVKAQPTPGPIDPAPTPVKPVIGNVSDDVKAEIKPELAVTEGDPAAAAKKIGGALAAEQLTRNKDGNTIVEPEVAVKAANKLGTLSSVTSKDVVALPVFTTPAIDADKDKTIMISYQILGSALKAKKPADVKVLKILGAEKGELFTYASTITKDMDKKFTVMKDDDSGTIFTGEIDGYTMYRLALFIKDGGKFDLDGKKDGAVADPTVILGAEKRASGGSSSGCSAGLGALALLSLAALPLVYRRKK